MTKRVSYEVSDDIVATLTIHRSLSGVEINTLARWLSHHLRREPNTPAPESGFLYRVEVTEDAIREGRHWGDFKVCSEEVTSWPEGARSRDAAHYLSKQASAEDPHSGSG